MDEKMKRLQAALKKDPLDEPAKPASAQPIPVPPKNCREFGLDV
jgi:hypothetical protein